MTTTLQHHDHAIERCDATTGHAVVTVALCRDTATARMLVDAYNSQDRLQQREQVLRDALRQVIAALSNVGGESFNGTIKLLSAALAATEVKP